MSTARAVANASALKVVVFGTQGLVGSRFRELCQNDFELITPSLEDVDLLNQDHVKGFLSQHQAEVILNFAAFTNVDQAEEQKDNKNGLVYGLNCLVPQFLAGFAKNNSAQLVQISTDYVFDGKQLDHAYTEDDKPNPLSWYGMTKHIGDNLAQEIGGSVTIARIEMPYRAKFVEKMDIVRTYLKLLKEVPTAKFVVDQKITPCFIDDIVAGLRFLIVNKKTGVFHLGPTNSISPIDLAKKLAAMFDLDHPLGTVSYAEFYQGKPATRPQYCWLDSSKLNTLTNYTIFKSIEDCLVEFKRQVDG